MYLFYAWVWGAEVPWATSWPVAVGIVVFNVLLAWFLLKYYDEPLRKRLSQKSL